MDHQDFAQLLGNYGEFFGAVAVVVTLIYLSIQVRQNSLYQEKTSQIAEADVNYAMLASFSRLRQMNLDNSELIRRVNTGEDLKEGELYEFSLIAQETIFVLAHNYLAAKAMRSDAMEAGMVDAMYGYLRGSPGLKRFWRAADTGWMSSFFMSEFYEDVNRKLEQP